MATVLDEIAAHLAAAPDSVGTVGQTIHKGTLPEPEPNQTVGTMVAVYEYGGGPPNGGFSNPGLRDEMPGVQVVVRGGTPRDYNTPRTVAETIYKKLAKVQATTLSGTRYRMIKPQQSPFLLERDGNGRVKIACNFMCEKEMSA